MEEIDRLTAVLESTKKVIKALKDKNKKSDSYRAMGFNTHTQSQRAKASDRLTDACFEFDRAMDDLHADLVDADLAAAKDSYDTRQITHSAGFGHSYTFPYTPKIPIKFK